jgi:hypothetical protein
MVLVSLILISIGVALWYRRMHLIVNCPDRYEQFHEQEKKFAHFPVSVAESAARGLLAALRRLWEWLCKLWRLLPG